MQKYLKILTIAGSDCSGGAGIQADIKTITALGGYAMSVITAITAQNTQSVSSIFGLPLDIIEQQIESIFNDIGSDAVKIGMVFSVEIIELLLSCIQRYHIKNIILDPVMISKDGTQLLNNNAITALKKLFPFADLITPNIPEAECLLGEKIRSVPHMQECAKMLAKKYSVNILLKGGHLSGDRCVDVICLHPDLSIHSISNRRIDTYNTHGTGCTLSAAISFFTARGCALINAIKFAHQYLYDALASGSKYSLGQGNGPVNHLFDVVSNG